MSKREKTCPKMQKKSVFKKIRMLNFFFQHNHFFSTAHHYSAEFFTGNSEVIYLQKISQAGIK